MGAPERSIIPTSTRCLAAGRAAAGLVDDAEEVLKSLGTDSVPPELSEAYTNLELAMAALRRADVRLRRQALVGPGA